MSLLQEIKEMLSTWRATAVLLLLLAAAMAAATFLEAGLGTEAARGVVYHAWWFFVLSVSYTHLTLPTKGLV